MTLRSRPGDRDRRDPSRVPNVADGPLATALGSPSAEGTMGGLRVLPPPPPPGLPKSTARRVKIIVDVS